MEDQCYCGRTDPDIKPYMLVCDGCKKYFHTGCLDTTKLSPLSGDIFYQFKCRQCGEEGREEFERMKMQWVQVVMLTLYNLQLGGSGKCGYFRWKEHICAFIDKHWNHLFGTHRKKTSLWHGTVAGTLSTGCPGYFSSGQHVLGEAGWWKLTEMKPPTLRMESGLKMSRKKMEAAAAAAAADANMTMKVEGLRSRQGRSSIEAAIALKAKRSTLTEAKEMRKARAVNRTPESTPTKPPFPSSSESASTSRTSSPLPKVENFELFQSETSVSDSSSSSKLSEPGHKRKKSLEESSFKSIKLEVPDDSYGRSEEHSLSISLKQEPIESEDSLASAALQSLHQRLDMDSDSQFSHSSSHLWFTDKDTKPSDTMPEMFLHNDSDSDLEIDPGTMSPPAGMSSASFRESPSVQDILQTMDASDNSRQSEDSTLVSAESKPTNLTIKSETATPEESENEAEEKEDEEEAAESSEETEPSTRKKKVEEEKEEEEPPAPRLSLMSVYEEHQLLRKLNMAADKVTLDPELKRLRRKLIVRQLKRERGMAVFDIDMEMKKYLKFNGELNKLQEAGGQCYGLSTQTRFNRSDMRILDRFQCNRRDSSRNTQLFSSFLNRLVGTEDNQLQSITSPYTTRVLKPFIRRDYESKPIKMKLLEEIVAYPHRNDKTWEPCASPPIDYCYVRPQHIPSVNNLCREFFWPGIDLSECLQYPDFSCVVLYRKIVIGFAFMVPDVKYNEAYISFIFTHPEWRRAGIATFMLYHLIQTCMGKDVTLHVSATNSAMLLYQKFGFKTEEMILDFYDKYYPVDSHECKHAFFLRLRR